MRRATCGKCKVIRSNKQPEIEICQILNELYSEKHLNTSCDRQIVAVVQEIEATESNYQV